MKKAIQLILIWLVISHTGYGQSGEKAVKYGQTISENDLSSHLSIIASDALEGRETGMRGQKMAAAYIKAHFQKLGLEGPVQDNYGEGHYQKVPLYTTSPGEVYINIKGKRFENLDQVIFEQGNQSDGEKKIEVVFGGSGTADEISSLDIKGKGVTIINENFNSVIPAIIEAGASMIFIQAGMEMGVFNRVKNYIISRANISRLQLEDPGTESIASVFFITPEVSGEIFGIGKDKIYSHALSSSRGKKGVLKKVKPSAITYSIKHNNRVFPTENVLGYLEGTDRKDELVVITAHYDHVGINGNEVFNGADDNGSGTVTVLELAEAFAKAKEEGNGPRRSILFMTVSGEEKGLLGSEYYTDHPVFPLENTVVNLNIDMVGRTDPKHEGGGDYIYLIGSDKLSTQLHDLSEKANATYTKMELDYTYNDESHPERFFYRSDHWNFAKNNIPIIFYFTGTHADYHQSTDTVEKIEFDKLEKRARLIFYTAWEIANREERLKVDK